MKPIKIRYEDSRLRIVSAGHILFALWPESPMMDQMRMLERVCHEFYRGLGGHKYAFVNVAMDGVPNFTDEVRAYAARLAKQSGPYRLAAAHVMLIPGLRGIAVRSFLSTMLLLGSPPVPTKVFDSMASTARWLLPHVTPHEPWTDAEFLTIYEQTRPPRRGEAQQAAQP